MSSRGNYYSNYQQALDDEQREAKPAAQPAPPQQMMQDPPQHLALDWQPRMDKLNDNISHVARPCMSNRPPRRTWPPVRVWPTPNFGSYRSRAFSGSGSARLATDLRTKLRRLTAATA